MEPPKSQPSNENAGVSKVAASLDEEARREQADRLLINPTPGWVLNYSVMAVLAALIAGLGMRLDSAPIVIGAMLVAPVMRPVLGLGFACLTAVPLAAVRRLLVVLALTSFGLVGIGWLLTVLIPSTEPELAGEVLARTAPDIRDLLVALAAGAVGAFAIMRPKVGDTITGVAIAVALVPPPVAAGIALGESFGTQARGALLLYGTNLVAIVFGTVLTVLGLRLFGERPFPLSTLRLKRAIMIVVVLGLGAGIPLAASFTDAVEQAQTERDRRAQQASLDRLQGDVRTLVQEWIADSAQPNLEIVSVDVPAEASEGEASLIAVVLLGQPDSYIPPLRGIETRVGDALGRPVDLGIRLVGVADQVSSAFEIVLDQAGQDADRSAERRSEISAALDEWTSQAGAASRILEISTIEEDAVFVRIAIAGAQPPIQDLHALFIERLDEIPAYELVVEELQLPPSTLRASAPFSDGGLTALSVTVDGRAVGEVAVCQSDPAVPRYLVSAANGAIVVGGSQPMVLTSNAGQMVESTEVSTDTNDASGTSRTFIGEFDRSATGISVIEIVIGGTPSPC